MRDCNKLLSKTQKIRDFNAVLLIQKLMILARNFKLQNSTNQFLAQKFKHLEFEDFKNSQNLAILARKFK